MPERVHEIDVVELLSPVDGWPVGTRGTVVLTPDEEHVLVEISRERDGAAEAFLSVPYDDLRVVWRPGMAGADSRPADQ